MNDFFQAKPLLVTVPIACAAVFFGLAFITAPGTAMDEFALNFLAGAACLGILYLQAILIVLNKILIQLQRKNAPPPK